MILVRNELVESTQTLVCLLDHTLLEVFLFPWFFCTVCFEHLSSKIDVSFRKRTKEETFVAYLD